MREKEEREGQTYLKYQPHPPLSVLVVVPLVAIAGIHAAALMMDLISLIALAIMVILIRKSFALYLALGAGLAILAATISWSPVLILLRQSQSALFVALLIVLAWFFLRCEWVVAAGIPLGIATCLKLYPGLLLVYLLLRYRRALLSAIPTVIVFALLPIPWMGWHSYVESFHTARATEQMYSFQNHAISLLSMFRKNGIEMGTAALMAIGWPP